MAKIDMTFDAGGGYRIPDDLTFQIYTMPAGGTQTSTYNATKKTLVLCKLNLEYGVSGFVNIKINGETVFDTLTKGTYYKQFTIENGDSITITMSSTSVSDYVTIYET